MKVTNTVKLGFWAACVSAALLACNERKSVEPAASAQVVEETYEDGTPKMAKTYEGGIASTQVEYYEDGTKKLEGQLDADGKRTGNWKFWHRNGLLNSEYNYRHGQRHGLCTVYYDSGLKRFEGRFQNDKRIEVWYFWNDEGRVDKKLNYGDGNASPVEMPL